jgi:DNA-binding PadR family transcriptional regulator
MSETERFQRGVAGIHSPLAWAVLGLVIEQPSHGHELACRFRHVYGEALGLSNPKNVYRLIETLHARELIEETEAGPDERPARNRLPKHHFRATAEGVRGYQEWLLIQLEESRSRERLFARQLAMLEPEAALAVIDRYEQECLTDAEEATPVETAREGVAHRLADQDEQLSVQARLSWIRYAREELAELLELGSGEGGQK